MGAPDLVVVHPLVLLSVVDHYNRVARDTKKRVVGLLLGETYKGRVDITNSFAGVLVVIDGSEITALLCSNLQQPQHHPTRYTVPFEEDEKDPTIWFLDHSYLEAMFQMFKKVNAKERVLGWYSTGPRLREADLDINDLMSQFCDDPVLVICDIQVCWNVLP